MSRETQYIVVPEEDFAACDAIAARVRDDGDPGDDAVVAVVFRGVLAIYQALYAQDLLASPCTADEHAVEVVKRWKERSG